MRPELREKHRPRILFLVDTLWGTLAGTEKQLMGILSLLVSKGYEVHLCCLYSNDRFPDLAATLPGCRTVVLDYRGICKSNILSVIGRIRSYVRAHKIDVLHTYFADSVYVGTAVSLISPVKRLVTSRRSLGYWYTGRDVALLRLANRFATSVTVNSEAVEEMVKERENCPPGKISVIYNGIDVESYRRSDARRDEARREFGVASEFVVGMVANVRPVKKTEVLLRALRTVKSRGVAFSALICGDCSGEYAERMKNLTGELGLEDDVRFLGSVADVTKPLSLFDVGVLTSESEGFSNSLLEYMALEVPIVATNVGGNVELLRGTWNALIEEGDEDALADRIVELAADPDRRRAIGRENRDIVLNTFAWDVVGEAWDEYYRALVGTERSITQSR